MENYGRLSGDATHKVAGGVDGMAAIFNLNSHATYVHWHFIDVSLSNVLVVVAMLILFGLALVVPFPRHGGSRDGGRR